MKRYWDSHGNIPNFEGGREVCKFLFRNSSKKNTRIKLLTHTHTWIFEMLFSFFFWRWFISNAEALKNKQGCLLQNFHSKHSDSFIFELSQKKQQFREGKSENNWISFPSCSKTQNRAVWHQSPISTLNILISFWSSDNKYLEKEISGGFSPPPPPGAFLSANIQRDSHAKCTGRFPCWGKTHALILFYGQWRLQLYLRLQDV